MHAASLLWLWHSNNNKLSHVAAVVCVIICSTVKPDSVSQLLPAAYTRCWPLWWISCYHTEVWMEKSGNHHAGGKSTHSGECKHLFFKLSMCVHVNLILMAHVVHCMKARIEGVHQELGDGMFRKSNISAMTCHCFGLHSLNTLCRRWIDWRKHWMITRLSSPKNVLKLIRVWSHLATIPLYVVSQLLCTCLLCRPRVYLFMYWGPQTVLVIDIYTINKRLSIPCTSCSVCILVLIMDAF